MRSATRACGSRAARTSTTCASRLIGGGSASQYDTDVGIRSIKVVNGRMLLNGRPVELRGASMHEDSPDHGMALTPQQLRGNVGLLRALGATVTRAHYPLHPLTLELCDRLGIMVWEQIPFNRGRFGNSATSTESPDDSVVREGGAAKALGYVRAAIARDQNHPAVFAWSVANEPNPRPGHSERVLRPTRRSCTSTAARRRGPRGLSHGAGVGRLRPVRRDRPEQLLRLVPGPSGTLDDRTGLRPFLRLMHDYYPHSALFVTEFGAEANRDGPIDEKGTYDFQQDLLDYHLDAYDEDKL